SSEKKSHQYLSNVVTCCRRSSTEGKTSSSNETAEATKESLAPTRSTGASRQSKQLAAMRATTSAPHPSVIESSCSSNTRLVFFTLLKTSSSSIGTIVLKSITSKSNSSAISNAVYTVAPQVTIVAAFPCRLIRPRPNGTRYSALGSLAFAEI